MQQITINNYEEVLNQTAKKANSRYYFACPYCNKPQNELKFNVYFKNNYKYKCFSCGNGGSFYQLKQDLNSNYQPSNDYKPEIKIKTLDSFISTEKLTEILTFFFDNSPLTDKHKTEYIKKRDSKPDLDNTFSFNQKAYKLTQNRYGKKLTEKIFYHFDNREKKYFLEDTMMFTTRDLNNNINFYEAKRYKDKFKRPLRNLGVDNKLPAFFNKINNSIRTVIICEGVEKAQTINLLFEYNNILAISIGSISRFDLLSSEIVINTLKDKEIIISFDSKNLEHITGNEEKNAIKLSKILNSKDVDTFISFLTRPTDKDIKEYDFDSYFYGKDTQFRKDTIYQLITNKQRDYAFYELYREYIDKKVTKDKTNDKRKHKISYHPVKEDKTKYIDIDTFRNDISIMIENGINNNGKVTVIKASTGGGKSYALAQLTKSYRLLVLTHNKDLARDIYTQCSNVDPNIEIVKSMMDIYYEEIDKSNLHEIEKTQIKNKVQILIEKGYNNRAKDLVQEKIGHYVNYIKPSKTKSLIATHQKALVDHSLLSQSFDAVIIDEDITDKMLDKVEVTLNMLKHEIKYYNKSNFTDLINLLIEYTELNSKYLTNFNLKNDFKKFLNSKDKEHLLYQRLRPQINKIKLLNEKNIDNLPDKTGKMKGIIDAILSNSISIETKVGEFTTDKVFDYLKVNKLETNNTLVMLDATANKNLISGLGFKISKFVEINIKNDNLKVFMYPEKTYKTGNILKNDQSLENFKKEIVDISPDKERFLLTSKKISEKIDLLPTAYFGRDDKGVNTLGHYETMILTTPEEQETHCKKLANLLYKDKITTYDTEYISERVGDNIDGQETYIESFHFKDKKLDEIYQHRLKSKMKQAIGRITRDYSIEKEVHIFSNVSLFDYGIKVNQVILKDKSNLDLRNEKTILAENDLKIVIKNSLLNKAIITTNNFQNYFSGISKNGKVLDLEGEKFATFYSSLKVETTSQSQLDQPSYNIYSNTNLNLLLSEQISLDNIMLDIKEKYNISDTNFKRIKNNVFSELNIKPYYLSSGKQGLFFTDNFELANKLINCVKDKCIQPINISNTVNNILEKELKDINLIPPDSLNVTIDEISPIETNEIKFDRYCGDNILELNEIFEHYKSELIKNKSLVTDESFSDFFAWIDESPTEEEEFKRLFLYECLIDNKEQINSEIIKLKNTNYCFKELINSLIPDETTNQVIRTNIFNKFEQIGIGNNVIEKQEKVINFISKLLKNTKVITKKYIDELNNWILKAKDTNVFDIRQSLKIFVESTINDFNLVITSKNMTYSASG